MIIVKCSKKGCKGHLITWNNLGKLVVLPNKTHRPEKVKLTEDILIQLKLERNKEPFATFMDVIGAFTREN